MYKARMILIYINLFVLNFSGVKMASIGYILIYHKKTVKDQENLKSAN